MEKMDASMQYVLQMTAAAAQPASSGAEKSGQSEDSGFRDLMEKARAEKAPENAEKAESTEKQETSAPAAKQEEEQPDEVILQELAAMQSLVLETSVVTVTQVTPEEQPVEIAAAEEIAVAGSEQMAADVIGREGQTVREPEAQIQTAEPTTEGAETVVEETAVQQPVQTENQRQSGEAPEQELSAKVEVRQSDDVEQTESPEQTVFGEVETAPIKVSETAAPQAAEQPQPVETQVEETVTAALEQGETRVELQLDPAELGHVTVELTHREDGSIVVALHADNSQTRALLEKDVSGLQQLLSRGSQQEVIVEVPRQEESQQHQDLKDGHQQQNHQQQEERQGRKGGEDFLDRLRLGLVSQEEAL